MIPDASGQYLVHYNPSEILCLCQKTLKVLGRCPNPKNSKWIQRHGADRILISDGAQIQTKALPDLGSFEGQDKVEIKSNKFRVEEPDATRVVVDLDPKSAKIKRLCYFDPQTKCLKFFSKKWKFDYRELDPLNPLFCFNAVFFAFYRRVKNKVVLCRDFDLKNGIDHFLKQENHVVAMEAHPTEMALALGDNTGKITILRPGVGKQLVRTDMHWHSLPVRSLCWSSDGQFLYSGGEERVLIKWNPMDGKQDCLAPRLSGAIEQIAVTDQGPSVLLSPSTVAVFDHHLRQTVYTKLDIKEEIRFGANIFWHRPTASLATMSKELKILFFDPKQQRTLVELEVDDRNKITGERRKILSEEDAPIFAMNPEGNTIAVFNDQNIKIWTMNEQTQNFNHSAVITVPHDSAKINCMNLVKVGSKNLDRLITSGEDGNTKVWQNTESGAWGLLKSLRYKKYTPLTHAVSQDRTVLAVANQDVISLWGCHDFSLKSALSRNPKGNYTSLQFCPGKKSHMLFATRSDQVQLWNVLTKEIVLAFKASEPQLHLGRGEVLLSTKNAFHCIRADFKVSTMDKPGVKKVVSDAFGNYVFVMSDNSVEYEEIDRDPHSLMDDEEADEAKPSFLETALKSKIKSSLSKKSEIINKSTYVRDFIPNKPLSYKLVETLEELL